MNILDIAILAVIGISVIFGMHRGFINGILNVAGIIVSIFLAFQISPQVALKLEKNETLVNTLIYYTDAGSRIKDLDISSLPVSGIQESSLESIIKKANLPASFESLFMESFKKSAPTRKISTLLSETIVKASISVLSFLITFLICYIIIVFLIHMISYVFEFPILRHLDALIGGLFGGIRGIFLIYIFFSVIPLIMAAVPLEQVGYLIESSKLAQYFDSRIIFMILRNYF